MPVKIKCWTKWMYVTFQTHAESFSPERDYMASCAVLLAAAVHHSFPAALHYLWIRAVFRHANDQIRHCQMPTHIWQ
eukprot:scaffold590505_cov47-Prasinocladus_malaysianus.AAC.1